MVASGPDQKQGKKTVKLNPPLCPVAPRSEDTLLLEAPENSDSSLKCFSITLKIHD